MKFLKFAIVCSALLLPLIGGNDSGSEDNSERLLSRQKRKFIFPQFSVYQISLCLVAQISSLPTHKVAINSGFQINYQLPFRLKDFYSPIYWARSVSNVSSPFMSFFERLASSGEDGGGDDESAEEDSEEATESEDFELSTELLTTTEVSTTMETTTPKLKSKRRKPKMKRDLSAGQFYSGIAETLSYSGYHEDCLLKSVCELAKHPLLPDEENDNVMNDVLHFILTPSLHNAFDHETEARERKLYEEAEEMGKSGADCDLLYGTNCISSPLETISRFIHSDEWSSNNI